MVSSRLIGNSGASLPPREQPAASAGEIKHLACCNIICCNTSSYSRDLDQTPGV
jgi:hypothetical protein